MPGPENITPLRLLHLLLRQRALPELDGKEPACSAGDPGSIPGSGRSSGNGNGYPLQYICLENFMDGEPGGPQSLGPQSDTTE